MMEVAGVCNLSGQRRQSEGKKKKKTSDPFHDCRAVIGQGNVVVMFSKTSQVNKYAMAQNCIRKAAATVSQQPLLLVDPSCTEVAGSV